MGRAKTHKNKQLLVSKEIVIYAVEQATDYPYAMLVLPDVNSTDEENMKLRKAKRLLMLMLHRYAGVVYEELGEMLHCPFPQVWSKVRKMTLAIQQNQPTYDELSKDWYEEAKFQIRLRKPKRLKSPDAPVKEKKKQSVYVMINGAIYKRSDPNKPQHKQW